MNAALRIAGLIAAGCVSVAALAVARGQMVQTTPTATNAVYRENLWTGSREFCGVTPDGASCIPASQMQPYVPIGPASPRFNGTPVQP